MKAVYPNQSSELMHWKTRHQLILLSPKKERDTRKNMALKKMNSQITAADGNQRAVHQDLNGAC